MLNKHNASGNPFTSGGKPGGWSAWKTGTSFAAPVVTAVMALLLAMEPILTAKDVATRLAGSALLVGVAGRDTVFGHGVVQAAGRCRLDEG
ncbi:MAG: hypothetical protein EAZ40_08175 [Rhodobacterales bacterium]|nr:MAG: hypothetical protein EAZ40_08175 [Rhodobacterales bacterium]